MLHHNVQVARCVQICIFGVFYDCPQMMKLVCWISLAMVLAACGGAAPTAAPPSARPSNISAASASLNKPAASGAAVSAKPGASGSAAAKAGSGATPTKFTVPFTAVSAAFTGIWVAGDEQFFAKHGFDVTVQYMDASVAATALISGEIPFSSTPAIVNTILSGGNAVIIGKLVSYPNFSLYVKPDIQSVEALKGKVLADTQRGTAPDIGVRALLAKHGLKDTDLEFAYAPNPSAALAILSAGQASAAILPAPVTVQARTAGFKELTNTVKENVPGLAAAISTTKERLKNDPMHVREYLSALKEATAFMKANPDRTKAIIGKYSKTSVQAEKDEAYSAYEPTWVMGPVTLEDIVQSLRYSSDPRAGTANPKTFFDNSIVDALK